MSNTAVGLFQGRGVADQVVHDLEASAFPSKEIRLLREPLDMAVAGVTSTPHTDFEVGLDRDLRAMGASQSEANAYVQEVRRGGVLVFATGSTEQVGNAAEVMRRHGAIQVEELAGREPDNARMPGASLPLARAGMSSAQSTQTGRVRQDGDGVRMFVW